MSDQPQDQPAPTPKRRDGTKTLWAMDFLKDNPDLAGRPWEEETTGRKTLDMSRRWMAQLARYILHLKRFKQKVGKTLDTLE